MDGDGSSLQQLTHGAVDAYPQCTLDRQWLVYVDLRDIDDPRIMRVPVAGGTPESLAGAMIFSSSADGKLLAVEDYDKGPVFAWYSTLTRQKVKQKSVSAWPGKSLCFSTDNTSLLFTSSHHGVGEIWEEPFDQQPPKLLASFPGKEIKSISSSPNGIQIGFTSVTSQAGAVILQDRSR